MVAAIGSRKARAGKVIGAQVRYPRIDRRVQIRRLLEQIGSIPPAEAEARYYAQTEAQALAA